MITISNNILVNYNEEIGLFMLEKTQKISRMTRQRSFILEELRKVKTHPTAETLYAAVKKRLPNISLGTVYRNLDVLVESGEIRKIYTSGSVRRFDADLSEHSHARCTECDTIIDIFNVPAPSTAVVNVEGFLVTSISIEYEGLCSKCIGAKSTSKNINHLNQ